MIFKILLFLELALLFYVYWAGIAERRAGRGPLDVFVVFSGMNYASTIWLSDLDRHGMWLVFVCAGLHGVVLGAWLAKRLLHFRHRKELKRFEVARWIHDLNGVKLHLVVVAVVISGLVVIFYYWYLGFFVPLEALSAYAESGDVSQLQGVYSIYRKIAHYGTHGYYAPGYFGQFKDVLLPVIVILFGFVTRNRRSGVWFATTGFFFLFALLGLVGTGRRFPVMVFLAAIFLICTWRPLRPFALSRSQSLAVSLMAVAIFGLLSSLMARGGIYGDLLSNVVRGPLFLFERVLVQGPEQRLLIFDLFLRSAETSWGVDWIRSLSSVLPGNQFVLSNELHRMLFGSEIGSAGLDLWGELWLNFNWLGALVMAPIWGFLLQFYYVRLIRGHKSISRVVILLYGGFVLAIMYNPIQLFIQGFVTLLIFRFLLDVGEGFVRPSLSTVRPLRRQPLRVRDTHGVR